MSSIQRSNYDYGSVGISRDLNGARGAYEQKDVEASRLAHQAQSVNIAEAGHMTTGGYLKTISLGGMDGILTSFAIVASAAGGGLDWTAVLAIGFANIIADAMSMGVGEFLSEWAETEWILREKDREEWEVKNYKKGEIEEMIQLYEAKGMSKEDATNVINVISKYEEFFLEIMMMQELNLQIPSDDWKCETLKSGLVMFISFMVFGLIPLLGYIILPSIDPDLARDEPHILFTFACVVTGIALFLLGVYKSRFGQTRWWIQGLQTTTLGAGCAAVAYSVGFAVSNAFSVSQ